MNDARCAFCDITFLDEQGLSCICPFLLSDLTAELWPFTQTKANKLDECKLNIPGDAFAYECVCVCVVSRPPQAA